MKRIIILSCSLIICTGSLTVQAQDKDSIPQDSVLILADDPIASMLDSLSRMMFYDNPSVDFKNKYGFPIDSVPLYSDSIYAERLARLNSESPFELRYNAAVRNYIDLYAYKRRSMVQRMLGLSEYYFPMFEEILDRRGIPLELKYLAIVESALNPTARSRAGAVGLWQFMYGTGKMMGLKITSFVDERSDPRKATEAACDYIQFLYEMFGDWQMVLAAYNGGPGTVSKAIRRSGGKSTYWEIRPYLPRETQGYVPAFIAVNYIMNYWEEHNLIPATPKLAYCDVDTVNILDQLSFQQISKVLDMPIEEIKYLNPSYRRMTIPHSEENCYSLCLPADKIGRFISNEKQIYEFAKKDSVMKELAVQEITETHIVRKGEYLGKIASRYGCSPADLKAWNNLRSSNLRVGQKLIVYVSSKPGSKKPATVASNTSNKKASDEEKPSSATEEIKGEFKYVTVQKGDSLWSISQQHGVTVDQIKKWNNMRSGKKILPGQKIKILASS